MDLQPLKIERDRAVPKARTRRRRAWITPLVLLCVAGALFYLFQAPLQAWVDRVRLPEVRTVRVVRRSGAAASSVSGASANGYIVAKTRAALSADTPGRIVEMNVEEGSVVKRGDIVARLYSEEYAALLRHAEADFALAEAGQARALAEANVAQNDLERLGSVERAAQADVVQYASTVKLAELNFERAKNLLEGKIDTAKNRDQAWSEVETARARGQWAQAQLEAARAAIVQAQSQLVVSEASKKEASARLEMARASRDQAAATLEKTQVRAPFDGIVVLKDAEVGEVVSPNSQGGSSARGSVVTMVDFASLEVQAEVPETSLAAVRIGANAQIYLDAFPDKPYRGRVDRIWPTANRTKATVEVRIAFEELDDRLRPEMGVRVVFLEADAPRSAPTDGDLQASLVIATDAVIKNAGKDGVFVLERDTVRFRPIVLGDQKSGKAVVLSGLSEGEELVLAPPVTLQDGDRVRIKSGA